MMIELSIYDMAIILPSLLNNIYPPPPIDSMCINSSQPDSCCKVISWRWKKVICINSESMVSNNRRPQIKT